jgi:hypothetical protein
MKNILLICMILVHAGLSGQNITTLEHTGTTTVYYGINSLIDAYTASVSGDTLYLSGGFFNSPLTIDKSIQIYGAGHYPDSTTATNKTIITSGGFTLADNADNFHLEGVEISGITFAYNNTVNNVTLKRNHITGTIDIQGDFTVPSMNTLIIQNVIDGNIWGTNAQFLLLTNNIVSGKVVNMNSNMMQNNIFLADFYWGWGYWSNHTMYNINSCSLNNNIFLNTTEPTVLTGIGNFVNNNVFLLTYSAGSNIAVGNYNNVAAATLFMSQSGNIFDYTHNYHLQSPASYPGTDATQCGAYGGSFPYKEGAVPVNPHIISKSIATSTTPAGDLNINITVGAQDE